MIQGVSAQPQKTLTISPDVVVYEENTESEYQVAKIGDVLYRAANFYDIDYDGVFDIVLLPK